MSLSKLILTLTVSVMAGLLFSYNITFADIYTYVDGDGSVHLTNVYNSTSCEIYGCSLVFKERVGRNEYEKIKPISAIIMLCKSKSKDDCDDIPLYKYINNNRLKFLTRSNLEAILNEHSLHESGLTENETRKEIGKIVGASHMLVFKKISDYTKSVSPLNRNKINLYYTYNFELINIETTEVEYIATLADVYGKATEQIQPNMLTFFKVLEMHRAAQAPFAQLKETNIEDVLHKIIEKEVPQ